MLGRIPARTTKDVEVCIDKIISYEVMNQHQIGISQ